MWIQKKILLPELARGCHLVTHSIVRELPELKNVQIGILHLFLQHTSASLAINENADPDVRHDMEIALNRVVPETQPFIHTIEGADDMPAHVKSALLGVSLSIPITDGEMAFGTWQGIYLCEHRNHGGRRRLIATLQGETKSKT
jgi:secondary thiamine-phosphate synthase enzyme